MALKSDIVTVKIAWFIFARIKKNKNSRQCFVIENWRKYTFKRRKQILFYEILTKIPKKMSQRSILYVFWVENCDEVIDLQIDSIVCVVFFFSLSSDRSSESRKLSQRNKVSQPNQKGISQCCCNLHRTTKITVHLHDKFMLHDIKKTCIIRNVVAISWKEIFCFVLMYIF